MPPIVLVRIDRNGMSRPVQRGVAGRLSTFTSQNGTTRKRFVIWVPLAALVLVYVVADAVAAAHHWFGAALMLLLLCVSTYDLITRNP